MIFATILTMFLGVFALMLILAWADINGREK